MVKVRVMTSYIKYTPEVANDWKQAQADVQKDYPHQFRRMLDASTASQMQSKLWLVNALEPYHPKKVAVIGGWFCHYLTEMLIDIGVELVQNFEIDEDSKNISYKYNKRYKDSGQYQCSVKDVMFKPLKRKENPNVDLDPEYCFDTVINTSCEHMFPMKRFVELNRPYIDPLYVLQSTNEEQYDDHINCVSGPEELAEQADIFPDVLEHMTLNNGMERYMVIGYDSRGGQ